MKKRVLGLVMAAVMVASSLVGCGGTSSNGGSQASGDKIELRLAQASAADGAIGQSLENLY